MRVTRLFMDLLKSMAFPCDKCNYLYGTNNCNRIKLRLFTIFLELFYYMKP